MLCIAVALLCSYGRIRVAPRGAMDGATDAWGLRRRHPGDWRTAACAHSRAYTQGNGVRMSLWLFAIMHRPANVLADCLAIARA